jgi:hypothetical protein
MIAIHVPHVRACMALTMSAWPEYEAGSDFQAGDKQAGVSFREESASRRRILQSSDQCTAFDEDQRDRLDEFKLVWPAT